MKTSLLIGAACAVAVTTLPPGGPARAGEVTLGNGDVLEGEVVQSNDAGVELVHDSLGEISIPADEVAGLKMSNADPAYTGGGDEGWFFPGWDKSLGAGFNGATGNADTLSYYASFETGYEDDNDRWDILATYFYAENDGEESQNEFLARAIKDWLIPGEPYFFWASLQHQIDTLTEWENRTSGFVGVGYEFINRPDDLLFLGRLGAGGQYEAGDVNEFTPELFLGLEVDWTINDQSSLNAYTYFYPSLDPAFEDYRNQTGVTYSLAIDTARGLSLELGARNDFDSSTEDPFDENDLKYFGALVYDF